MPSERCAMQLMRSHTRLSTRSGSQACRRFSSVHHQALHNGRSSYTTGSTALVARKPTTWLSKAPTSASQRRWISATQVNQGQSNKIYKFDDILHMIQEEKPDSSRLLIDVREPHEFNAGSIPTAINIPVSSQPDALLLDAEDFQDRFGFAKPPVDVEVVFFCKSGVRSRASAGIAREGGYKNVAEYPGSWTDWARNGGPSTQDSAS